MRSLTFILPQIFLVLGSVAVLLSGLWTRANKLFVGLSLASLGVASAYYLGFLGRAPQDLFAGLLSFDPFGVFFGLLIFTASALVVLFSARSQEIPESRKSEYFSILLVLCTGMALLAASNHFLMIYLALETVSILSYTLSGFHKEQYASNEASLKYVVYGSLASAIMVYGMSLLYGVTGSMDIISIKNFLSTTAAENIPTVFWISTLMLFVGIAYKISAAPMHMWAPDVYEGSPTPVTALFSVAPKAAGFALLLRVFITGFSTPAAEGTGLAYEVLGPLPWPKLLMLCSVLTMCAGNLAAIAQTSVKRILAYSSIAHAGYILMGATTQTELGTSAILFYLCAYCLMNIGAFWVASRVEDALGGDKLEHFSGLIMRSPVWAVLMTIFLCSLIGLPPFVGFVAKFKIFQAVIVRQFYGFALIAGINSVVSLYYYMKIAKAMIIDRPVEALQFNGQELKAPMPLVMVCLLAIPTLLLGMGVGLEEVFSWAVNSVKFFKGV